MLGTTLILSPFCRPPLCSPVTLHDGVAQHGGGGSGGVLSYKAHGMQTVH